LFENIKVIRLGLENIYRLFLLGSHNGEVFSLVEQDITGENEQINGTFAHFGVKNPVKFVIKFGHKVSDSVYKQRH
jgi:hypothetical protein